MKRSSGNHFAGIIPARYASSRFPGKPLAIIGNKPMIQLVYEQASRSLETLFVASDDERIAETVRGFGGNVIMTSIEHRSGTDRCAEATAKIVAESNFDIDIVINIQGDEPFIKPEQIDLLKSCFDDESVEIATLIRKVETGEDIFNPNHPKVIRDYKGDAMYFSRAAIPFLRDTVKEMWTTRHCFYKHLGIYAYTRDALHKITRLQQSVLETAESLEQNRWIENGFKIRTAITNWESISVDTPDDLEKARLFLNQFR